MEQPKKTNLLKLKVKDSYKDLSKEYGDDSPTFSGKQDVCLVITALAVNCLTFGSAFCLGVLYPEFVRVFNSERASAAMVQGLYISMTFSGGVLWNPVVVKFGTSTAVLLGGVLTCVGMFISIFSVNIWMIIVFLGILAGFCNSIVMTGPFLLIVKITGRWKDVALSITAAGSGLGQFVFPYLLEMCLEHYGWRGALLILTGVMGNLIPCGLLLYTLDKTVSDVAKQKSSKLFDAAVFKQWRYYLLLIGIFLFGTGSLAESRFLVDEMIIKGIKRATGSEFISYIGLASVVGRLLGTAIKIFFPGRNLLQFSLFSLVNGGSHALAHFQGSYNGILAGVLLNGLSFGLCVTQLPVIMLEIFPQDLYGPAVSVMFLVVGVGNFVLGFCGGLIFDLTNNYDLIYEIAIGGSIVVSILFLIVGLSLIKSCIKQQKYVRL